MKIKWYVLWMVNIMAYSSLMVTVYSKYGLILFIKVLIPSIIIFGSFLSVLTVVLKESGKAEHTDE